MKISIAVPIYEMKGVGDVMLRRCLNSIARQEFKDYEVIISDNSTDEYLPKIRKVISEFLHIPIKYVICKDRGATKNTNNAIKHCAGEVIHILNQDDAFHYRTTLRAIVDRFRGRWMISGCSNNPHPLVTGDIHKGNNKLGSPSCLTMLNESPLLFDEKLHWLFDCDYYKRMLIKYGDPIILPGVIINIGTGDYQLTNLLSQQEKEKEILLLSKRYA